MARHVAQVLARDLPHVDAGVVAGGEEYAARHGHADVGEGGVGRGALVGANLLVAPQVPQTNLDTKETV